MEYRWQPTKPVSKELVAKLENELGIEKLLAQLLIQRDIKTFDEAKAFFRPSLDDLHDPFLMLNMRKAVDRINKAINDKERILIYGDYDVDGTTSVSLMYSFLIQHHDLIDTYIPDRYKEGYGISIAGIDYAADNDISLIIALDCGIKAVDQVNYANEKSIDFIICDHHRPGDELPEASALLDPKQKACSYPYDELSGCGVGFKLVQALCKNWELDENHWLPLLDLLAISIGADIVPITGENRILTYHGLKLINSNPRPGIKLLVELAGKSKKQLSITDVVFALGPRINAAGRISHGRLAVELLIGNDEESLEELCQQINLQNTERKELDGSITQSAMAMIESSDTELNRKSTVLQDPNWHKGVIGIVASRLIEKHYRPTVIFTQSGSVLAGSARSVKGFDVYNALESCSDILEQFGGHMYAAGMTLKPERFEAFKTKFEEVVDNSITPEMLSPEILIDGELLFSELSPKFFRVLKQYAPFGPKNMAPIFVTHQLKDTGGSRAVGGDKTHLRVELIEPNSGITLTGIGFGMADKLSLLQSGKEISVCYHLEENEFRGMVSLQLHIKDLKLSSEA